MKVTRRPFAVERRWTAKAEQPLDYICDLAALNATRSEGTRGDVKFIVVRNSTGARLFS
jgi:hypothetical protein